MEEVSENILSEGHTQAEIKAGEQMTTYKFVVPETSTYMLEFDADVYEYRVYDSKENEITKQYSYNYDNSSHTKVVTYSSWKKQETYYIQFYRRNVTADSGAFLFDVSLTQIPYANSVTLSAVDENEITIMESTLGYYTLTNMEYSITYSDGVTSKGTLYYSWFEGKYTERYYLKLKSKAGTIYGEDDLVPSGEYSMVAYDDENREVAVCNNLIVHVTSPKNNVVGTLVTGENSVTTESGYYTFKPTVSGKYSFQNVESMTGFYEVNGRWKELSLSGEGTVNLNSDTTYYFYFKRENPDEEENHTYTITLAAQVEEITSIENASGKTQYLAYCEPNMSWNELAFRDWILTVKDSKNKAHELKIEDLKVINDDKGNAYLLDESTGLELRYEIYRDGEKEEYDFYGDTAPGTYKLTLYLNDADKKGVSYTVESKLPPDYDWSGREFTCGKNQFSGAENFYKFTATESGTYAMKTGHSFWCRWYTFDETKKCFTKYDASSNYNDETDTHEEVIQSEAGQTYYIYFGYAEDKLKTVTMEKNPSIVKVSLNTDVRTNKKLLAATAGANSEGYVTAKITYSDNSMSEGNIDDYYAGDGKGNELSLNLKDENGFTYSFDDAIPAGKYTVIAKCNGKEIATENAYTVTVANLEDIVTPLKEGENQVDSGWMPYSEYAERYLSYGHLYVFTPQKTAMYHFTPAAHMDVYTKDANGKLVHSKLYGNYEGTDTDDIYMYLSQGTTYYISFTGCVKTRWDETYSWGMQISSDDSMVSAKITGVLSEDTFYAGGNTKEEIENAVKEAVKKLEVTYADGSTATVAADTFEIDYPDDFEESGQYKLDVNVWVKDEVIKIPEAIEITLLTADDALEWNVSQPLTTSYEGTGLKQGQALLYKLTGLKRSTKYKIASRSDVQLSVSASGYGTSAEDIEWGNAEYTTTYMFDDDCYVWVKPPVGVSRVTLTAYAEITTDNVTIASKKPVLYAGVDRLDAEDVILTFTTPTGETYSRTCRYEDDVCVRYPNGEVYYIFADDAFMYIRFDDPGIYTFMVDDNDGNKKESGTFEVKGLDEAALKILNLNEETSLSDDLYVFTPSENGTYCFQNTSDSTLHPSFTYYEKKNETWNLCDENATMATLKAGIPYLFRMKVPVSTWKLTVVSSAEQSADLIPVKNISFMDDGLYYDYQTSAINGYFKVEYTDGTVREVNLEDIKCNKYLDYTKKKTKDTVTVYLRYRANENGAWTECEPQVFQTKVNHTLSLDTAVNLVYGSSMYTFTPETAGWYQIITENDSNLMTAWKSDTTVWSKGKAKYLAAGTTYYVVANQMAGKNPATLKVGKADEPVSLQIESNSVLGLIYNAYNDIFTVNKDDLKLKVGYKNGEKVLTGKDFEQLYGNTLLVTEQTDKTHHVVACIPDTALTDSITLNNTKAVEQKMYTTDASGTMTYSGQNGFGRKYTNDPSGSKWQPIDTFVFTPNKSGLYVMSITDSEGMRNVNCGIIYRKDGVPVSRYSNSSLVYLEKNETYYQALPYSSAGNYVLKLTLFGQEPTMCEHTYDAGKITKKPTCTTAGIKTYTCTKCGDTQTETIPVDKNAHTNIVTSSAKAATCTSTGLSEGRKCSACGTVLQAQTTIKALGHSYGNWTTTKAATVVAAGVQTRTCTRCGHQETRTLAKLASSGTLNVANFPLKVKQSANLKVNGMAAGDRVASWKSANTTIATVDGNGKVIGKKKGNTTITATLASGRALTATVKVQTAAVKTTGITVNSKKVTLSQNQSFQLVSVIAPFTSKEKLSYKTSNKKVATVSGNGKITAKKAGKATITVKSGKKSVKVTVNVIGVKTTGISVNTTQLNLKVKKKATIKAYVTPKNSSEKVTYKSSNKKIVTVDVKGKVTAKKAGTATITVTSGSKSVKVTVNVTK